MCFIIARVFALTCHNLTRVCVSAFNYNTCPCVIIPHVFVFVCHYNASVRIHMWLLRVGSWLRVIVTRCFAYVCIRNARTYIHICVSIWYVRSCLSYIRRVFVFVCCVDSIYSMFRLSKKPITLYNLDNYPLLLETTVHLCMVSYITG